MNILLLVLTTTVFAAPPTTMPLYPNLDPALKSGEKFEEHGTRDKPAPFIRDVRYPTITIHLPENTTAPTPAIIICPGGAYAGVSIEKEGHAVARWLNSLGYAGIVLKYRMPQVVTTPDDIPLPLQDARETLRIIRTHAHEWNIDTKKIGIIGFSAGGHLAATVLTHPDDHPVNFGILVYPVISMKPDVAHIGSRNKLIGKSATTQMVDFYSEELHVTDQTPPTYLVHAKDDRVWPKNSELFFQAMQAHHVPGELHLLQTGGHGFGLANGWTDDCAKWLREILK